MRNSSFIKPLAFIAVIVPLLSYDWKVYLHPQLFMLITESDSQVRALKMLFRFDFIESKNVWPDITNSWFLLEPVFDKRYTSKKVCGFSSLKDWCVMLQVGTIEFVLAEKSHITNLPQRLLQLVQHVIACILSLISWLGKEKKEEETSGTEVGFPLHDWQTHNKWPMISFLFAKSNCVHTHCIRCAGDTKLKISQMYST